MQQTQRWSPYLISPIIKLCIFLFKRPSNIGLHLWLCRKYQDIMYGMVCIAAKCHYPCLAATEKLAAEPRFTLHGPQYRDGYSVYLGHWSSPETGPKPCPNVGVWLRWTGKGAAINNYLEISFCFFCFSLSLSFHILDLISIHPVYILQSKLIWLYIYIHTVYYISLYLICVYYCILYTLIIQNM